VGALFFLLGGAGIATAAAQDAGPAERIAGRSDRSLSDVAVPRSDRGRTPRPAAGAAADRVTARVYLCGVLALLAGGMLILASASGLAGLAAGEADAGATGVRRSARR